MQIFWLRKLRIQPIVDVVDVAAASCGKSQPLLLGYSVEHTAMELINKSYRPISAIFLSWACVTCTLYPVSGLEIAQAFTVIMVT